MTDLSVSGTARRRIRSFSVWVWVCGAVVLSLGALNTYADLGIGQDGLAMIDNGELPWDAADPPVFEPDGITYSGEGSGLIRIPLEDHDQDPYLVSLVAGNYVSLFVTEGADPTAADRGYPARVNSLFDPDDETLLLPPDADLELWVRTEDPWEFTLQKTRVTEITDGFATGTGNGFLVYRGDAVSARFVHKGTGLFYVTVQTLGRADVPIIESGDVDQRQSWTPTAAVYFSIESDAARGVWSVDIDELATNAPLTPDFPKGTP